MTSSSGGGARTNDVADSRRSRCSLTRALTTLLLAPRDGAHQFYRHNQIYRDGAAINFYPVFNAGRNSRRATRLAEPIPGSLAVAFTVRFRTIRSSSASDVILGRSLVSRLHAGRTTRVRHGRRNKNSAESGWQQRGERAGQSDCR